MVAPSVAPWGCWVQCVWNWYEQRNCFTARDLLRLTAQATARRVRTCLFPNSFFNKSVNRGDDPVDVFCTQLRQQQFSHADFALNALNQPIPLTSSPS